MALQAQRASLAFGGTFSQVEDILQFRVTFEAVVCVGDIIPFLISLGTRCNSESTTSLEHPSPHNGFRRVWANLIRVSKCAEIITAFSDCWADETLVPGPLVGLVKSFFAFTSSLGMGSRRDKGHTALSFDHIQDSGRGGELHGEDAL